MRLGLFRFKICGIQGDLQTSEKENATHPFRYEWLQFCVASYGLLGLLNPLPVSRPYGLFLC